MMGTETIQSPEQLYKKNKRKAAIFAKLAPIVWWVFIALTIVFLSLAIENSIGNVLEILDALDKEVYNATEIRENYARLAERWGEWEVIGEENDLFTIRYINVANALFSGVMKAFVTLSMISLAIAIICGKIIFPYLHKVYENYNTELVDMATLKSAQQIDEMTTGGRRKEWF